MDCAPKAHERILVIRRASRPARTAVLLASFWAAAPTRLGPTARSDRELAHSEASKTEDLFLVRWSRMDQRERTIFESPSAT